MAKVCRMPPFTGENSVDHYLAFWKTSVQDLERLRLHLGIEPVLQRLDPRCRFLLVMPFPN